MVSYVYASYSQEDAPLDPLPKAEMHYRCLIVDGVDIALGDTVTIEVSLQKRTGEVGRKTGAVKVGSLITFFRRWGGVDRVLLSFWAKLDCILPTGLRNCHESLDCPRFLRWHATCRQYFTRYTPPPLPAVET